MASQSKLTVTLLQPAKQIPQPPSHHVGNPPSSFLNPWPSFKKPTPLDLFRTRFTKDRNFEPIPPRDQLVPVRKPDWAVDKSGLKATWIGHAGFLVELPRAPNKGRGLRVLCDPVFSERSSPVKWAGPKRYTPRPCSVEELPEVDAVVISHNHYDHLDTDTIRALHSRGEGKIHFFCALGGTTWFHGMGIKAENVTQMDWWETARVDVDDVGSVVLTCTPSQHSSGRGFLDQTATLWCSWVIEELQAPTDEEETTNRKLFFAGDTGYRTVPSDTSLEDEKALPHCPAFAEIGERFGPFDLALLPIGLNSPREVLSPVHCNPDDAVCLHRDLRSKKSVGMHWGTFRGGISQYHEPVTEPPRQFQEACKREGMVWGEELLLMDIGETLVVV